MKKLILFLMMLPLFSFGQIDDYTIRARYELKTDSIFVIGKDTFKLANPLQDNQIMQRVNGTWVNTFITGIQASDVSYNIAGTIYDSTTVQGAITQIGNLFDDSYGGFEHTIFIKNEGSTPIQDAVDLLSVSDTVLLQLDAGIYNETVTITNKNISITGAGHLSTAVNGIIITQNTPGIFQEQKISNLTITETVTLTQGSVADFKFIRMEDVTTVGTMTVTGASNENHLIAIKNGFNNSATTISNCFFSSEHNGWGLGWTLANNAIFQHNAAEINGTCTLVSGTEAYLSGARVLAKPNDPGVSAIYIAPEGSILNTDGNTYSTANVDAVDLSALELQDANSSGSISPKFIITENVDGTIDISNFPINLYNNINHFGKPRRYNITGVDDQVLTNNSSNFISVDFNSGNPILRFDTFDPSNESNIVLIAQRNRRNTELHGYDLNTEGEGKADKINKRLKKEAFFKRANGLILGELPTRYVTSTAGLLYIGASPISLGATNSSTGILDFYAHVAGVYTLNPNGITTQYNNSQYDNGTNLVTMGPNKFKNNFIYRDIDNHDHIFYVIGNEFGTVSLALAEPKPTNLPQIITNNSTYLGRIIVGTGLSTAALIISAFEEKEAASGVIDHDNTGNIKIAGTGVTYGHINSIVQSIYGAKTFNSPVTAPNFISTVATGTAPYATTSTTLNTNLNADLLDGQHGAYYKAELDPLYIADTSNIAFLNTKNTFTKNQTISKIIGGTSTTSDLYLQTTSGIGTIGADMHFLVGNNGATEAMTILNNANVGIGTTSPSKKLDVNGTSIFNGESMFITDDGAQSVYIARTAGSGSAQSMEMYVEDRDFYFNSIQDENTGYHRVNFNISGPAPEKYYSFMNGNVGIGTTAPTAYLHIKAGTASFSPFRLSSGILKTSPDAGDFGFLNDRLYFAITTGPAWKTFAFLTDIYPSAGIALSTGSAWGSSITDNSTNWNTAYTDRLKWDGGSTGLVAATGRTSLGANTIGSNIFTLPNPDAITFMSANANNTVSMLNAADFRTAIGVLSISGSGTTGRFPYFSAPATLSDSPLEWENDSTIFVKFSVIGDTINRSNTAGVDWILSLSNEYQTVSSKNYYGKYGFRIDSDNNLHLDRRNISIKTLPSPSYSNLEIDLSSGNWTLEANLTAATYGSDGSVSDTELKYINTLSSNAQTQLSDKINGSGTANIGTMFTANKTIGNAPILYSSGNAIFSGKINTDNATDATTTTDGSLQTDGGLSVVKSAVIGANIAASTYGSDGSVSNTELLYINTLSSNAQDQIDAITAGSAVLYQLVTLDATAVSNSGSAQTILAAPGAGKEYMIVAIRLKPTVSTPLEVGTQTLQITTGGGAIYSFTNNEIEANSSVRTYNPTQLPVAWTLENTAVTARLSSGTNPTSGDATWAFRIIYKIIDL